MRTVSMINESNLRSLGSVNVSRNNIMALRQQMAAHNFRMGSIPPDHHSLDLHPKRLSVQDSVSRNAIKTNAQTIIASGMSISPSLGTDN